MNALEEKDVTCPYCGETFSTLIDLSAGDQIYIEDCAVCCQPIELDIRLDGDDVTVDLRRADE